MEQVTDYDGRKIKKPFRLNKVAVMEPDKTKDTL